ncbi:MAG: hypothetical protein ACM3QS_13350 [Bacteroidota bacterium]
MQTREEWPRWAALLQRYRLDQFAAWMLEAGGPIALLGAQALYFGRSFLGPQRSDPLARMLENEAEARGFAAYLHSRGVHG